MDIETQDLGDTLDHNAPGDSGTAMLGDSNALTPGDSGVDIPGDSSRVEESPVADKMPEAPYPTTPQSPPAALMAAALLGGYPEADTPAQKELKRIKPITEDSDETGIP